MFLYVRVWVHVGVRLSATTGDHACVHAPAHVGRVSPVLSMAPLPPSPAALSEELIRRLLAVEVTSGSPAPACLALWRRAPMGPLFPEAPILETAWPGAPREELGPFLWGLLPAHRCYWECVSCSELRADCTSQRAMDLSQTPGGVGSTDPLDPDYTQRILSPSLETTLRSPWKEPLR